MSETEANTVSNKPWGTIIKPGFELGHQKLTEDEIDEVTNRLYYIPKKLEVKHVRNNPDISVDQMEEMVERLTKYDKMKITDSDRRLKKTDYSNMGIVHSFAWKGYN